MGEGVEREPSSPVFRLPGAHPIADSQTSKKPANDSPDFPSAKGRRPGSGWTLNPLYCRVVGAKLERCASTGAAQNNVRRPLVNSVYCAHEIQRDSLAQPGLRNFFHR